MDFNLVHEGAIIAPKGHQLIAIRNLFPTAYNISLQTPFIVVTCHELPQKPWPVTVAGLALFLTTDRHKLAMDCGQTSFGPAITVDATIDADRTPGLGVFEKVFKMFKDIQAPMNRLQWYLGFWIALATNEPFLDWQKRLPTRVNGVRIMYKFGKNHVTEPALQLKVPRGSDFDDTAYPTHRPGIMITSVGGHEGDDMSTTAGICVRSSSGQKYMAVASRGFPGGVGDIIYHPDRHGHPLGEVAEVFGVSGVSLAKFNPGIQYSNETFSVPETIVHPFRKLTNTFRIRPMDVVTMDTAFNGHCEGVVINIDVLRLPKDEPADEANYVVGQYSYFGNGGDAIFEGSYGSAIWNEDFDVLGQLDYQQVDGPLCYCPSYDHLQELGYTSADHAGTS
ncbi:MAG: hypothetical protein Q9170_001795 [Blastenia crenularia]